MLIATLRDKGKHPCPHCLIMFEDIPNLGTPADKNLREHLELKDDKTWRQSVAEARRLMYDGGYAINGDKVDSILKDISAVPTKVRFFQPCYIATCH
jgi:hypothetical protein